MPLAVGRGIDRSTGTAAVQPQYPVDVRNVLMRDAMASLRGGMAGTGYPPLPWGTHTLWIGTLKATLELLAVQYDSDTRDVRVYRLNQAIGVWAIADDGEWGTLNSDADFPVVMAAEADGRMFFFHTENDLAFRLQTVYYQPDASSTTLPGDLLPYEQDLNGDGVAAPTYFSGGYGYLEYLMAWGYGSENPGEEDASNALRIAQPGAPLTMKPGTAFQVGLPGDPILDAIAVDGVLALLKNDSMFYLGGTSPADFGVFVLDEKWGTVSCRCTGSDGKNAYTWSNDGARQIKVGGSIPIAQPLALLSPAPSGFPARGPARLGFFSFDQSRKTLEWNFPDIENGIVPVAGYLLSLWDPNDPRWTLTERQVLVTCAGLLVQRDTGASPEPPEGYVSDIALEDVP